MASDIVINIASQFTGKKAFKQADTATEKLNKSVKKLASAIGLASALQPLLLLVRHLLELLQPIKRLSNS